MLKDGYVVIFTAGTGNPFSTTDTWPCLKNNQNSITDYVKATRVDGVYSEDPERKK